jgi:hypothetical protein
MALPTNPDGSLRAFTDAEVTAMEIRQANVRDGAHPTHVRRYDASSVTRTFLCKYDEFENFVIHMLGASSVYFDTGLGRDMLTRIIPQTWPGRPYLAATAIESATGFGRPDHDDTDEVPTYPDMKVVVRYEHVPFGLLADADTSFEWRRYTQTLPSTADVSYLNLPGGIVKYIRPEGVGDPHGIAVPYSIGYPQPSSVIRRKWCRVPEQAWGAGTELYGRIYGDQEAGTKPYVGTINSAEFLGYPPGYLLFLGVEEEPRLDPTNDEGDYGISWDLTYTWLFKPDAPHNWLRYFDATGTFFPGLNGFYLVGTDSTYYPSSSIPDGYSLFNARDHNKLFWVGAG